LDELELRVQQAAELGFEDMHVKFAPALGRPLVGGFRPTDVVAQKALKQRFFADVPESALLPTYEDLRA